LSNEWSESPYFEAINAPPSANKTFSGELFFLEQHFYKYYNLFSEMKEQDEKSIT